MPVTTIPLVGQYNTRRNLNFSLGGASDKDQRFMGCLIDVSTNPLTKSIDAYIYKRPGVSAVATIALGQFPAMIHKELGGTGVVICGFTDAVTHTIYHHTVGSSTVNCGTTDGVPTFGTEAALNGIKYFLITDNNGKAYYLPSNAITNTAYTADGNNSTTITDIKISGVNSVAGLYVGQRISAATNVAAGSRIVSIDSVAFSAVLDTATTGGAFNDLAITKEPLAKITNANFPSTITGEVVFLDGYFFVMDETNKRIYNSDLNSISSWSASSYITMTSAADGVLGVARHRNKIVGFGKTSIEFFSNAGNPFGSVLTSDAQLFSMIGSHPTNISGNNIKFYASAGDNLYFVGASGNQNMSVFRLSGLTAEKISTSFVDKVLTLQTDSSISAFNIDGTPYVCVHADASGTDITFIGNLETGYWTEGNFVSNTIYFSAAAPGATLGTVSSEGVFCLQSGNSGKLYCLRADIYQDNGEAFSLKIRTKKIDFGTNNRKFYNRVTLIGSDVQSSGTATLEYSDDDYVTWTTAGTFDMTKTNPFITRCGSHQAGRAWRITHSANTAFRAQSLQFDYEVGSH